MLRIALCDDETESRDALRFQLEKILVEDTEEIVYEFSSGINAASWLAKHPGELDLLFLDVEMKGLNGMETAEKIREFDTNLIIVFVTGYADYVFDGYRIGALDYLMKPVTVTKLQDLLHRIRVKLMSEESQTFTIKTMDGTWRFRLHDILYFYSDKRKVTLVTAKGEYPFYAKLDDIEKELASSFVRIHQRYLINPAAVDYLKADSVTLGAAELPCSRKYKEAATARIARTMMGGMKQ
ncbi:MAG: LytTR family DNA-binding domain-containing protein [Lachnospiraceae bacterium]|nr:LytTR family DNA-binding domain-containing protein [Lachnospiraceae bacterium]